MILGVPILKHFRVSKNEFKPSIAEGATSDPYFGKIGGYTALLLWFLPIFFVTVVVYGFVPTEPVKISQAGGLSIR